jgi:nitrite reductase (NADH) small subunit
MRESRWIRVTALENIPAREGRAVQIGDREIAIFNLGDRLLATSNRCPHKSGPLCDGIVTGNSVVCPLHAWKVSLVDGSVERPSSEKERCIETYPVRVDEGVVVVAVPCAAALEEQVA